MSTLMTAILSALGGAIVTAIISVLKWSASRVKQERQENKVYETAIKAVVHDSFFRACRYALSRDEILESDLENIEHLYASYHALGLNGLGDRMHEQVKEKPVRANR